MHEEYMRQALDLAREAAAAGEVPVGCVIVRDGAVVGRGRNRREERQAAWSHAEKEAMAEANPLPWWAACWRRNAPGSCRIFSGACARSKISLIFPLTKPGKVAILCHIECKCSDGDQ